MKVYNASTGETEPARHTACPRCKGFGAIVRDGGADCDLCRGNGWLWLSDKETGWTRAPRAALDKSKLY